MQQESCNKKLGNLRIRSGEHGLAIRIFTCADRLDAHTMKARKRLHQCRRSPNKRPASFLSVG